jgi:hypothetical protein
VKLYRMFRYRDQSIDRRNEKINATTIGVQYYISNLTGLLKYTSYSIVIQPTLTTMWWFSVHHSHKARDQPSKNPRTIISFIGTVSVKLGENQTIGRHTEYPAHSCKRLSGCSIQSDVSNKEIGIGRAIVSCFAFVVGVDPNSH